MVAYLSERGYHIVISEWHPTIRYVSSHDWHSLKLHSCDLSHEDSWGNLIALRDAADVNRLMQAAHDLTPASTAHLAKRIARSLYHTFVPLPYHLKLRANLTARKHT